MAFFTFNILHQKSLLSRPLSKCPSPLLNTAEFPCFFHLLVSSPPKHTPFSSVVAHASSTRAHLSPTDRLTPEMTTNSKSERKTGSGLSSLSSEGERRRKQYARKLVSPAVEEKTENTIIKKGNIGRDLACRKRRKVRSVSSPTGSRDGSEVTEFEQIKDSQLLNGAAMKEKKTKGKGDGFKVKMEKGSKEEDSDSKNLPLRASLDMCSKRGDVMGAIKLYDLAQREGIKLGQYHYTVLLYLCSSAAVGFVQPAKSGSVSRTLHAVSNRVSDAKISNSSGDTSSDANTSNIQVSNNGMESIDSDKMEFNSSVNCNGLHSNPNEQKHSTQYSSESSNPQSQSQDGLSIFKQDRHSDNGNDNLICVSEDVKIYALHRGFEIYERMCMDNVPMNEAILTAVARMAMSTGNGDMAFDMVKKMKSLGIKPKLRSYGPALTAFCSSGDIAKAFSVEEHMLKHDVYPEEPELEALLKVSIEAGKADKVYYLLHKLRTYVGKVSPPTAGTIVRWFKSEAASRVGKRKWDKRLVKEATENGGGGWHGQGWLGKGRWSISCTYMAHDGFCNCCGEKLVAVDLNPIETENFADSVASLAIRRDRDSSFEKFQKWLDYYGPFEAVVDAANVGLFGQRRFLPSKINTVVNGIRQKLPSKRWPLIILHNKRIASPKMCVPVNKALIEKWRNADALYATPTGSNDDWYWLYAAIKFKCLIVTNDEMRDHTFLLLGNDHFPKWKERHQVRFSFSNSGPVFHMPLPWSVVIQESEEGHWHVPIMSEHNNEEERTWLCLRRGKSSLVRQDSITRKPEGNMKAREMADARVKIKAEPLKHVKHKSSQNSAKQVVHKNLINILSSSGFSDHHTGKVLMEIKAAEKLGDCVIDFQI
ncbi:hypothetical protein K2173_023666 [Erythroxylum novogranatense]|uniref:ribonuclease P n=1 Tax=Erythroxylum novogranatense TaxID=1862640 RepID=A0AAV8TPA6_9ROSI|nr:hypothetical protein K2173_023666 [Erythroxylum novogranatense]